HSRDRPAPLSSIRRPLLPALHPSHEAGRQRSAHALRCAVPPPLVNNRFFLSPAPAWRPRSNLPRQNSSPARKRCGIPPTTNSLRKGARDQDTYALAWYKNNKQPAATQLLELRGSGSLPRRDYFCQVRFLWRLARSCLRRLCLLILLF